MGYVNDQFFGFGRQGNSGEDFVTSNADNPKFVYPDRTIRVVDPNGEMQNITLKRGYMRSLTTSVGSTDVPMKKCQFQFNPQNLTQSVSQTPSMLDFLHQDPAQYAQPMVGNVNFSFDLFFDRSMEMNNALYRGPLSVDRPNELNPWEASDPSEVGVLRDLAALYSVIGQGMSKFQSDYIKTALAQSVTAESNAATTAGDTEASGSAGTAISNIGNFVDNNMGNSAFLIPLPVRVVFSSLYIVEGLVTDSTVVYTKFNSSFVPMQAAVSITMEAKYIGFAKKDTFFTYALAQRDSQELQETTDFNASVATFSDLITKIDFNFEAFVGTGFLKASLPTAQAAINTTFTGPVGRRGGTDAPSTSTNFNANASTSSTGTTATDPISNMFINGEILSIEVSAVVQAYGPITSGTFASSVLLMTSDLLAFVVSRDFDTPAFECSITPDAGNARATDTATWKTMTEDMRGVSQDFSAPGGGQTYIYHYTTTITVTTGTSTVVGTGDTFLAATSLDGNRSVPINWPDARPVNSTSGTVAADNGASVASRTQPGNSSPVGAV